MKYINLIIFATFAFLVEGCSSYRGAVYSDYTQAGLDIRSSAASGAPVQVNFGYDQGVFAYVPKQNADTSSTQGEAVSLISWNNMAAELNPMGTSSNSLLRVDAGFISGIASDIAAAPAGSTVTIVAPGLSNTVAVTGEPGARIAVATSQPTPFGPDSNTDKIQQWIISDSKNRALLRAWLDNNGYKQFGITNIEQAGQFAKARQDIVTYFKIQ